MALFFMVIYNIFGLFLSTRSTIISVALLFFKMAAMINVNLAVFNPVSYTHLIYDERNGEVDVALLDIMMPQMDGLELCKQLRARSPRLGLSLIHI